MRARVFLLFLPLAIAPACGGDSGPAWPPAVGQIYPDLELQNHLGVSVKLSDYRGKVLLIEPIGMPSEGCIAWNGGHRFGAFRGVAPQADLRSIEEYFPKYTDGTWITDPEIVVIQILFFNMEMETPTLEDAQAWIDHFEINRFRNYVVLIGNDELRMRARQKIPGFQLVDRNFVLRADSAGNGRDNLYTDLLPAVPRLIKETARPY